MLSKYDEGIQFRGELPHETRGIYVFLYRTFIAHIEKHGTTLLYGVQLLMEWSEVTLGCSYLEKSRVKAVALRKCGSSAIGSDAGREVVESLVVIPPSAIRCARSRHAAAAVSLADQRQLPGLVVAGCSCHSGRFY